MMRYFENGAEISGFRALRLLDLAMMAKGYDSDQCRSLWEACKQDESARDIAFDMSGYQLEIVNWGE